VAYSSTIFLNGNNKRKKEKSFFRVFVLFYRRSSTHLKNVPVLNVTEEFKLCQWPKVRLHSDSCTRTKKWEIFLSYTLENLEEDKNVSLEEMHECFVIYT
jgi:hypothetical protein